MSTLLDSCARGGIADALGSGPSVHRDVGVQLPPCVPTSLRLQDSHTWRNSRRTSLRCWRPRDVGVQLPPCALLRAQRPGEEILGVHVRFGEQAMLLFRSLSTKRIRNRSMAGLWPLKPPMLVRPRLPEPSARGVLVAHFVRDEGHVSSILTALTISSLRPAARRSSACLTLRGRRFDSVRAYCARVVLRENTSSTS